MFFKVFFKFQKIYRAHSAFYSSCPSDNCNKKVIEVDQGYRCEACNKIYDNAHLQYTLSCQISDNLEQMAVTVFRENATKLLGMKVDEFKLLCDENPDEVNVNREFVPRSFLTFSGIIKAQMRFYNGNTSHQCSLVKVEEAKDADYAQFLLDRISAYSKAGPSIEDPEGGIAAYPTSVSKGFDY